MPSLRGLIGPVACMTLVGVGCASTPPPAPAKPVTPKPTATAEVPPPAEPDLSPVSEPANIVGLGRWKSAAATLDNVKKLLSGTKVGNKLARKLDREIPPEVMKFLKIDSSVDLAIALDPSSRDDQPEFSIALSVPFRSVDDVKSLDKVQEIKPGIYRIGSGKTSGGVCLAARSVGDAPIRLVCGEKDRDLDALLPWMTRGMPNAQLSKNDLHFELRAKPMQERYAAVLKQLNTIGPALATSALARSLGVDDPVLAETTRDVVSEGLLLADDIDSIWLDGSIEAQSAGLSFSTSAKFKGQKSWFTKAITAKNNQAGPPPSLFWNLPSDSDAAGYNHGGEVKLWTPVFKQMGAILKVGLTQLQVAPADRDALAGIFAHIPLSDTPGASASGHIDLAAGTSNADKPPAAPKDIVKEAQARFGRMLGWSISGQETAAAPYVAWLKEIEKAYNRPTLQTQIKKGLGKQAPPTVKVVAAPAGMPKDTTVLEFSISLDSDAMKRMFWSRSWDDYSAPPPPPRPGMKPPPPPARPTPVQGTLSFKIVVMPDGNRVWVGFGADADALKNHLLAAKADAPKDKSLANRAGLDALKTASTTSGGFVALGGFIQNLSNTMSGSSSENERKEIAAALAAMPNKGMTPMLLLGTATSGPTPSNTLELRVPKATLDDIIAMMAVIR